MKKLTYLEADRRRILHEGDLIRNRELDNLVILNLKDSIASFFNNRKADPESKSDHPNLREVEKLLQVPASSLGILMKSIKNGVYEYKFYRKYLEDLAYVIDRSMTLLEIDRNRTTLWRVDFGSLNVVGKYLVGREIPYYRQDKSNNYGEEISNLVQWKDFMGYFSFDSDDYSYYCLSEKCPIPLDPHSEGVTNTELWFAYYLSKHYDREILNLVTDEQTTSQADSEGSNFFRKS